MTPGGIYARIRRHQPSRQIYRRIPRQPGARTFDRSKFIDARRQAAEERFPSTVRQQLLDALAAGALLRDVLKVVPVTSTTLWERTRWDPIWAEQLVSVLDEHRPAGWSHGHAQTYYRGAAAPNAARPRPIVASRMADTSRPPTPVDDETILRLHADGLTGRQIGERLGMPAATVHTRIRRHRLTGRPAHSPRTKLDVDRMIKLYESGLTLDQVGQQLGVLGSTVGKRLRAAGVERRRGGPARRPVTDQRLIELRAQGLTGPEIGRLAGW